MKKQSLIYYLLSGLANLSFKMHLRLEKLAWALDLKAGYYHKEEEAV